MSALLNRFLRQQRGMAAVELALVTPVFLLMFLSSVELGHLIYYQIAVEKSVRSAVTFLGRHEIVDAKVIQETKNIVMYGNPAGVGQFIVPGFASGSTVVVSSKYFDLAIGSGSTATTIQETAVWVEAYVQYLPLVPQFGPVIEILHGGNVSQLSKPVMIKIRQEQAVIGS